MPIKQMLSKAAHMHYYQTTWSKDKVMSHEIPGRLWEFVRADIFTVNNKHFLCIVDYHIKFPIVKQVEGFTADNLMKTYKLIFSEYRLWQDSSRCRHTLFRKIWKLLQKAWHAFCSIIIRQPPQQWTSRRMHHTHKEDSERNAMKLVLTYICLYYR